MRKKTADVIIGLVFLLIGACLLFDIAGIFDFNYDIWDFWPLAIILPCVHSIVKRGYDTGSLIGACIGLLLLSSSLDIVDYVDIWKYALPALFIIVGLSLLFKNTFNKNVYNGNQNCNFNNNQNVNAEFNNNGQKPNLTALFGGTETNFDGREFNGANCNAIFGGYELDLRNSTITQNCVINASAIFGGVEIFLPSNVVCICNGVPILGGVDNKFRSSTIPGAPIVKIDFTCIFGGIDIH